MLASLIAEEATLRAATSDGLARAGGRKHVIDALLEVRTEWRPDTLQVISVVATDLSSALQFRVQSRESEVVVEVLGSAFLRWEAGVVADIDLYLPQPIVAAARGEMVRGNLGEAERMAVARMLEHRHDFRDPIPPRSRHWHRRSVSRAWSELAEPGSNSVNWAQWSPEEADERIDEIIQAHRSLGLGFNWTVGSFDTPADLGQRLVRHGLLRAGDVAMMLKFGLDDLDTIPTNSDIEIHESQGTAGPLGSLAATRRGVLLLAAGPD